MAVQLRPCNLLDGVTATCSFARCDLPGRPTSRVLVVSFGGEADNTDRLSPNYHFMRAMVLAGLATWRVDAIVLDMRDMRYSWGDEMILPLAASSGWPHSLAGGDFPAALVLSNLNREGLTSLVRREVGAEHPEEWLCESLEEALASVDRQRRRRSSPRGENPTTEPPQNG